MDLKYLDSWHLEKAETWIPIPQLCRWNALSKGTLWRNYVCEIGSSLVSRDLIVTVIELASTHRTVLLPNRECSQLPRGFVSGRYDMT